jgi:hypothetical protein
MIVTINDTLEKQLNTLLKKYNKDRSPNNKFSMNELITIILSIKPELQKS